MWWLESTPLSSPIVHSTSNSPQGPPVVLKNQHPVATSVSPPDAAQPLNAQIQRLEALVAEANSRVAAAKRQSEAENQVHSTILRHLKRKHDKETGAFRKRITAFKHSLSEAANAQKQMLVQFASRQSEQASKIDAAEQATRLASEKTNRLRQENREFLARIKVQAKLVAKQTTQLEDLQSENSRLLHQLNEAIGNCQQIKTDLQLKDAALKDSSDRLIVLFESQRQLDAELLQQQVEHTRQIADFEQKSHLASQEEQIRREHESQTLQRTISV